MGEKYFFYFLNWQSMVYIKNLYISLVCLKIIYNLFSRFLKNNQMQQIKTNYRKNLNYIFFKLYDIFYINKNVFLAFNEKSIKNN